jgi:HrpA-like RNA helicase
MTAIEIPGKKCYEVEDIYHDKAENNQYVEQAVQICKEIQTNERGDTLVFLPSADDIDHGISH